MLSLLGVSVVKEWQVLLQNKHALLVLFVMPLVFVLIMSLALQERINGRNVVELKGSVEVLEPSELADTFLTQLNKNAFINIAEENETSLFSLRIKQGFQHALIEEFEGEAVVELLFSPRLGVRERSLVLAAASEAFANLNVGLLAAEFGFDASYLQSGMLKQGAVAAASSEHGQMVNATQQNVPAWLVFAMFFVSLPIATVVLYERQQKTLTRLRVLGISSTLWLVAKLLPYLVINILQFILLLVVGVFLLPVLGGTGLGLDIAWFALIAVVLAVSVAALGVAALIACMSRSSEQATILAGTSNILMGALGGIMVPKFVMPEFMQWLTYVSPMGWGLEGFLSVLAFGHGFSAVIDEIVVLMSIGFISIGVAAVVLKKRIM